MIDWILIIAPLVFGFGSKLVIKVIYTGLEEEDLGIRQALPALASTYLVYVAYTVVIGLTYGWILHSFPQLSVIVQYISVVAMCGLAYLILMRSKSLAAENYLSIGEEFMVRAIRPATPLIVFVLFSVFLDVTKPLVLQVVVMTLGFIVLSFTTQVFWIVASQVLDNEVYSEKTLTILDRVMTGLYVLLAAYIAIL
ncbi:MAG: hypothetical protein OQL16_10845 [Gammaproteobacteria bacterium]|nr:hypothetical protein [Gammaproteobacteria bacterium]